MYKSYRHKTILLYVGGALAIGAAVLLIGFFVYMLALRTEYRDGFRVFASIPR